MPRSPVPPVALLAFALAAATPAPVAASSPPEVPLPTVEARRTPRLLHLKVVPADGTHLAPDLPLRVSIVGGGTTVVERNGAVPDAEGEAAKLSLPIFPKEAPDGWRLSLDGGACSDGGDLCVPFHVEATLPREGPPKTAWETTPGRAAPDAFGPEEPRESPHRPPSGTSAHRPLPWFDAAEPGGVEAAFADAATRETVVLADFFAVWCPPCDLLRDEFLHAPEHRDLVERFTLLRLDADSPDSFATKDRYRVGGYPTVLILAANGEVLDRIEGYPGRAAMATRLEPLLGPRLSLQDLRDRYEVTAAASPERHEAGRRLVARLAAEGAEAEAFDVLLDAFGPVLLQQDDHGEGWPVDVVPLATDLAVSLERPEADHLLLLRAALPGSLDERALAVRAAAKSIEGGKGVDPAAAAAAFVADHRAPILAELRAQVAPTVTWTADGSGADVTRLLGGGPAQQWRIMDAAYYLATTVGTPEDEARDLFALAASSATLGILQSGGKSPSQPPELEMSIALRPTIGAVTVEQMQLLRAHEGRYHDLVSVLIKAGLHDVAEDYLRRLVATFPDTFTWHYRHAGFLRDHRSAEEALPAALSALEHGYGDNALRAATRLAQILETLGRADEALDVIDVALAAPTPAEENVRTHRYRGALQALRASIAGK